MSLFSVKEALQAVQKPGQHRSWLMLTVSGLTGSKPSINFVLSLLSTAPAVNDVTIEYLDAEGGATGKHVVRLDPNNPAEFLAPPKTTWGRIRATHPVYPAGFVQLAWNDQPSFTRPIEFHPIP